jgi:hypothetical protein
MPYIVTTYEPVPTGVEHMGAVEMTREPLSRRAVATLENRRRPDGIEEPGARQAVISRIAKCAFDAGTTDGYQPHEDAARTLPESGGTVGPLPDGTVIEVKPESGAVLAIEAGLDQPLIVAQAAAEGDELVQRKILDAFNARQS